MVFFSNINHQLAHDNNYVKIFIKIQPKNGGHCSQSFSLLLTHRLKLRSWKYPDIDFCS